MATQFVDDKFKHLEEDIDKIREKYRMYISFSNEAAALAVFQEMLYNALDECRNPRSPGNKIIVEYDEREDTISVEDNGRGIPTEVLELVLTTLNSGSNIDSGSKNDLATDTLGRNGVGTLAMTALGEHTQVTTYRGGTENKMKMIEFKEGRKVNEAIQDCPPDKHGLKVIFKPSKILGRNTRIVWAKVKSILEDLQFMNRSKIGMTSLYTDKTGKGLKEVYKPQDFAHILQYHNTKGSMSSPKVSIGIEDKNVMEDIGGKKYKRFVAMDVAFGYAESDAPYISSFCNMNATIDNGSHIDASIEAISRYFQQATKASLSERDKLDIKWDDVRTNLTVAVSLRTNMEEIFTSQTKHKVSNDDLYKLIKDNVILSLQEYFKSNASQLKELINIVKTNARARREGDKARNSVVKDTMTNWSSFKMKNFDPCTAKGKEYKELYIIEGD